MQIHGHNHTKQGLKGTWLTNVARANVFPKAKSLDQQGISEAGGSTTSLHAHLCRSWNDYFLARRCSSSESRIGAIVQWQGLQSQQAARNTGCWHGINSGCQEEHGLWVLKVRPHLISAPHPCTYSSSSLCRVRSRGSIHLLKISVSWE